MSDLVLSKNASVSKPPAGTVSIYPKDNGEFYTQDDQGVEKSLKGEKGESGENGVDGVMTASYPLVLNPITKEISLDEESVTEGGNF